MEVCQNNKCKNEIKIPSLDCPGQCLPCAIESRKRVEAWKAIRNKQ